jgi:hypothetical protein
MKTLKQFAEATLTKPNTPVVNSKDEIVGYTKGTSIVASKILGRSALLRNHPKHGWSWVPVPIKTK